MAIENWQRAGFGVYVHWPFCQAKCPYCDFNSHVSNQVNQRDWVDAYRRELDRHAQRLPERVVSTIFFGGGTPSLMDAGTVSAIIDHIRSLWPATNDIEVSLEANPTSVEAARFAGYRDAGVNRVSIGVQALNDDDLKRLGRLHSTDEALSALELARSVFPRVSFDLIYARQFQSLADWTSELNRCLDLKPDHLSLYQLTIEENTAFGDRHARGGLKGLPADDLAADMFELTRELTETAGLPAYEVSNHARSDAEVRHNLIYWRNGDWIGVGPGAHGRHTVDGQRFATETPLAPSHWLEQANQDGATTITPVPNEEFATEYLMMSLRLSEGTDLAALAGIEPKIAETVLDRVAGEDLPLVRNNGRLRATAEGRMVLNTLLLQLLRDSA